MLNNLIKKGILSPEEADLIKQGESNQPFSVRWELMTLLYLGVILLNIGLGTLIYEHIDTIGHSVIIALIAALCGACFWYAVKHQKAFSWAYVGSPTPYFDYILLLGCFSFLILEGYLQYQYQFFGTRYGLATFIPTVLFFGLAYWFDHRGVLSLAIVALSSWVGITVTPRTLFANNDFHSQTLVITGVALGLILGAAALVSRKKDWKQHFDFSYLNFSIHLLMVSSLAGIIVLEQPLFYFPVLIGAAYLSYVEARAHDSLYFLIVSLLYGYIGVTYLIFKAISANDSMFYFLYFILTCGLVIWFLYNFKRILKDTPNDSI